MATQLAALSGTITIGNFEVSRIGLGTNRISDNNESKQVLRQAVAFGVNFIDTAHRYGSGASEQMIGKTLSPFPTGLVVATKGGYSTERADGSPSTLRKELEESLTRLKTDCIDLYQLHRIDPTVPIETSIGALRDLQKEGKIRHIGLSEVTVEQIERARKVAEIVSVQNQFNIVERRYETVVDYCTERGIVFIPWFPLGGSRGGGEAVGEKLNELAKRYRASTMQIALAWLLKRSPMILPIPGTLSTAHLEENLRASEIKLSDDDFNSL